MSLSNEFTCEKGKIQPIQPRGDCYLKAALIPLQGGQNRTELEKHLNPHYHTSSLHPESPQPAHYCPACTFCGTLKRKGSKSKTFKLPFPCQTLSTPDFKVPLRCCSKACGLLGGEIGVKGWTTKPLAFTVISSLEIQMVIQTQAPINKTANIWKEDQKHSKWPFFIIFFNQALAVVSLDESLIDILKHYLSLCSH